MITIIGTSHVDLNSKKVVENTIREVNPDKVFVELDDARYNMLASDKSLITKSFTFYKDRITDLKPRGRITFNTFRAIQAAMMGFNRNKPKSTDFKPAINTAQDMGIETIPIDRNLYFTMNKIGTETLTIRNIISKIQNNALTIDVNNEKDFNQNSNIRELNGEFSLRQLNKLKNAQKQTRPKLYKILVKERDEIMASNIDENITNSSDAVAVVGAMHVPGIDKELNNIGYNTEIVLI